MFTENNVYCIKLNLEHIHNLYNYRHIFLYNIYKYSLLFVYDFFYA